MQSPTSTRMTHVHNSEFMPVHTGAQIDTVVQLAQRIWTEHYLSIIGQAQIDYMLARFQSADAIAAQLREGYEYFLINRDGQSVGYAAVRNEAKPQRLFVSKLYLLKSVRGHGIGRNVMQFLAGLARQRKLQQLWLTVNKHNPAFHAYLRIGFVVVAEVVTDIGDGYVMDDYQMEWSLQD
jgi:ribosomal protein S18 acetylase RimI-like enzyme